MTAVLFTCAGQRVDIVTAFARFGAFTVAVDLNPLSPALYHANVYSLVPPVDDPEYIPALCRLIGEHDVRLVLPLTDLDHMVLAESRDALGAVLPLPDPDVIRLTGDKWRAHEFFLARGIPSPPSWHPEDVPADVEFPVLVKARFGFGSRHIHRANNREELEFFLRYTNVESFVQKVCDGEEFSIDVFCDMDSRCLNAIPRTMIESKGGESIKGCTVKNPELIDFGRLVAETLRLRGPGCVQCFRVADGRYEVTDVNPRFGGGFPLPLSAGGRYPELALALARGERPEPRLGDFREGVFMTRFPSQVCLLPGPDGTLEPFSGELSESIAGEPS